MPDLHALEAQGKRSDGSIRLLHLLSRRPLNVPIPDAHMSQAHTSNADSAASPNGLARTVDQQIATIERLAAQHYGADALARSQYEATLLKQRLREYAAKVCRLEVRPM
jgi:hypothetical protein